MKSKPSKNKSTDAGRAANRPASVATAPATQANESLPGLALEFRREADSVMGTLESAIEEAPSDTWAGRLLIFSDELRRLIEAGEALAAGRPGQGTPGQAAAPAPSQAAPAVTTPGISQTPAATAEVDWSVQGQKIFVARLIKDWSSMEREGAAAEMDDAADALQFNPLFVTECKAMKCIFKAFGVLTALENTRDGIDNCKLDRNRLSAAEYWFTRYWNLIFKANSQVTLSLLMVNLRGLGVIMSDHKETADLGATLLMMEAAWDILCALCAETEKF